MGHRKTPQDALAGLWRHAAQPDAALEQIELTGAEPALPSSFAVGTAAQASIAAAALAAAELWRLRARTATARQRRDARRRNRISQRALLRVDGAPPPELWDKIAGLYRCGDGRWVRLHTNFPHHRDGVLKLLGCDYDRDAVQRALDGWQGEAFETAAAEAGLVVTMTRSFAEWDAHRKAAPSPACRCFSIERIGDAPPRPLPPGDRPLARRARARPHPRDRRSGVRAHARRAWRRRAAGDRRAPAADGPLVIDNGRGKLSTFIDLRDAARARDARRAARAMPTSSCRATGRAPSAATASAPSRPRGCVPGIVYVSLSAYGHEGPWANRRGFDSLVQNANGINHAEAEAAGAAQPKPLPCQAIDHATGYLMAFGAMTALARRVTEGGSWHVRVSLAQTGHWIRRLGRVPTGLPVPIPASTDVRDRLEESDSGFGRLTTVRHAAVMAETPPRWARPSVPLGTHAAAWPT